MAEEDESINFTWLHTCRRLLARALAWISDTWRRLSSSAASCGLGRPEQGHDDELPSFGPPRSEGCTQSTVQRGGAPSQEHVLDSRTGDDGSPGSAGVELWSIRKTVTYEVSYGDTEGAMGVGE